MTTTSDQSPATLPDRDRTSAPRDEDVRLDVEAVSELLLGRWPEWRRQARERAGDPQFHKDESLTPAEHRERVLAQMRVMVEGGNKLSWLAFPERMGGLDQPGANLACFSELVAADPSLQIKSGVQWGLFSAAILHLGTPEQQDRLLPDAMDLTVPGAFAMTETGHGSDVAAIGTTATYDPETQEFVIDTPFRGAWKDYLGNAALHATAATVFAQLITNGVNHGVHCFYVPIRDPKTQEFLPGVGGEDDGLKGGLRGIDNGRLHFSGVRVPREDLLARYGSVAPDGTYSSPIESPGRRFFTMLGSLVQGRVSLDGSAVNAAKIGLAIAVKYAAERRQFAGAGAEETVLLDYATHRRRLFPAIAEAYAGHFANERLLDLFDDVFSGEHDTPERREDLETTAAALKSTSTRFALDTLQECREACGGAGFLTENRITSLHADLDVYATFEGDNTVLQQLVARRLVADYGREVKGATKTPAGMARFVVERATGAALDRTGLRRVSQAIADVGDPRRAAGHLRDPETQRELLADRVATMVEDVAMALRPAQKAEPAKAARIVDENQVALVEAAKAHADLLRWEAFTTALTEIKDPGTRRIMTWVRDVFGLTVIERNMAWYLLNGRLSDQRARTVTAYVDRLLRRLRPHAVDLVDGFGYGQEHLRAKISSGAEAERQSEARAYYAAQRASGAAPVSEKALRKSSR
ncbi:MULTISPECIES: acyl-CoA dehydrogenase [Isoptericola]|uniref:acyl-CoA oxidase n=1 Tax=Isoptericola sediminis TaxID=2733572 RepID=A0A849K2D3_9MICO|nr:MULTISPECIES: acyl-CoA dehydrogenase [Isoptericola]MDO8143440.1 acyl-CoA dehydrogenase [Isoptericola sp. 178]MDO8150384.1 acyl-CoA dehydrogenase [Isoptericola sp. b408]NNU27368.1 acyl-CoA dehydrogenase [Isoptericola sediminis]